ncbi:RtcB family protein [Microvirga sp. W0021]|uniref:3'-phosphate/5'-hydroxy nucleic acid ligase n=1 Tax=Hohaiivirga grylli TaxID=3133970 RepID=A0ABV0BI97_9HYPH
MFTGKELIAAGFKQGKWFREALDAANQILSEGGSFDDAINEAGKYEPAPPKALRAEGEQPFFVNIKAETEAELANVDAVIKHMTELMRTPIIRSGAIMPDACPAGPFGTIPVGGVVASEAIHPGMHSADICCSMAISVFPNASPAALLDAVHAVTHFGPMARAYESEISLSKNVLRQFENNALLNDIIEPAIRHFATQGDGNHFAFIGTLKSSGETALVTHHGSRSPGALLYKKGMRIADKVRRQLSPKTLSQNAWIPADTPEGDLYWEALQIIRQWTKENHFAIHDMAARRINAKCSDRFWNEHNFVFRRSDGLFYHGKGATPAFPNWADDSTDLTLIPLNMAQPILIARGKNAAHGLGFSPHGAGRNFSRREHKQLKAGRSDAEIFAEETRGIDARFFCGVTDISELPSAYKDALTVRCLIEEYELAEIVDEVLPYGCIMAGDWEVNAPWRKKA